MSQYYPVCQRSDVIVNQVEFSLETVDAGSNAIRETIEVIQPVNMRTSVIVKPKSTNGYPHIHVNCDIDRIKGLSYLLRCHVLMCALAGVLSIQVYERLTQSINKYIDALALDAEPSEPSKPAAKKEVLSEDRCLCCVIVVLTPRCRSLSRL